MQPLILVLHVLFAITLVVLVLLQQGKGAQLGAAFGSGASQTLFGSQGSGSFMLKLTGLIALLFFISSLTLGYLSTQQAKQDPLQGLTNAVANVTPASTPSIAPSNNSKTTTLPNAGVPIPAGELPQPSMPMESPAEQNK